MNIVNEPATLDYMLSDELGIIGIYIKQTLDKTAETWPFRMLGNIALVGELRHFQKIMDLNGHRGIVECLLSSGPMIKWGDAREYWCFNFIIVFIRHPDHMFNIVPCSLFIVRRAIEMLLHRCTWTDQFHQI